MTIAHFPTVDPLSRLVRERALASPASRSFDRTAWDRAHADYRDCPQAGSLFYSIMWFAEQFEDLHRRIAALKLSQADRAGLIRELCGRCNFAFVQSEARLRLAQHAANPGDLPMGSAAHVLFHTESGDVGNADAMRTSAIDSLNAALRTLPPGTKAKRGPAFGIGALAEKAFTLFNALYVLEFYCEKVLWQGWRVARDGKAWRIAPGASEPFERSSIALTWRNDQEHGEWHAVSAMAWRERRGLLEQEVYRDLASGRLATRVREPGQGEISPQSVLRWHVQASDLVDIAGHPLPAFAPWRVTLNDLVDAALLIGGGARVLSEEALARAPKTPMRQFAPAISKAELVSLLGALGWPEAVRAGVIDFFTYQGTALDGTWSKPLIPSQRGLIPVFIPLIALNLYRSAELWLADAGGEALQRARGAAFEARARRELRVAVRDKPYADRIVIAEPFSAKIAGARRDVDLALRIDDVVFVGEAKLKRFPAAPRENARWIDELAKGAGQAALRARHFASKPQAAAQATAFSGPAERLRFVPFVLTSGSFGAGVRVDGVDVIDFASLLEFFEPGYFGVSGQLLPGSNLIPTRIVNFHDDTSALAVRLEAYLADPVRVRVIESAMVPLARTIGVRANDGRAILCTDPRVDERMFAHSAASALEDRAAQLWQSAIDQQVVRASPG